MMMIRSDLSIGGTTRQPSPIVGVMALALLLTLVAQPGTAADWSRFRGPNGAGVAEVDSLPAKFGKRATIWRTEVPYGRSSPVLAGDSIFLSAADEKGLVLIKVDAKKGAIVWRKELERKNGFEVYRQNDSASSSPVTDDENVYAFFQELGLVSFSHEGEHRWTAPLGPFHNFYGMGSSPVLAGDLVILHCDQQKGSFIVAVNKDDGEVRWRIDRGLRGPNWTTPVVYPSPEAPESVLLHGYGWLDAYALSDGQRLWGATGFGTEPTASPTLLGDRLIINAPNHAESGYKMSSPEELLREFDADGDSKLTKDELGFHPLGLDFGYSDVDLDGFITREEYQEIYDAFYNQDYGLIALDLSRAGPSSPPEVLWRHRKNLPDVCSPLVHDGIVYLVKNGGIVTTVDVTTGEPIKTARLEDAGGAYFASPVAADGKVYIASQRGKITVLKAKGEWEVLEVNDLDEEIHATPAIADNRIYIRTAKALYSFGKKRRSIFGR